MMFPHRLILALVFPLAGASLGFAPVQAPGDPRGQPVQSTEKGPASQGAIKAEASLVLVDAVVTDRKKHYLQDLGPKDFHVFEDGVEQSIVSFSREADIKPDAPGHERYVVLFFDDSSPGSAHQLEERQAAARFVEKTASPNRMIAVVDFRRGLHVVQNFTANAELLNEAIKSPQFSTIRPVRADSPGIETSPSAVGPTGSQALESWGGEKEENLDARDLLLAIRGIANILSSVPGRKAMILFSTGWKVSDEPEGDFRAALDALNKANVAVYPVSARGLEASAGNAPGSRGLSATGMPGSISLNDQDLRSIATSTGGFPIVSQNDLTSGMQRISADLDAGYILGYVPSNPAHDGRYHKISVKLNRAGTEVRARDGYFDGKSPDPLMGKPEGTTLEARATSTQAGDIPITLSAPYFYVRPGVAVVNLALSIPASSLEFDKQKGAFHSRVDIVGIAYRQDGSIAARFSDTVNLDYDKHEAQQIARTRFDFQKCFKVAPGDYVLRVALSAGGQKFGKYVLPLVVDPFSGTEFTLAGPALGEKIVMLTPQVADMDESLLENTKPLIANGEEVVPSATNRFAKDSKPVAYVELYDPLAKTGNVKMGILFKVLERGTNHPVYSSNTIPISQEAAGHPLVPAIFNLPIDKLQTGQYRMEVWGRDSDGNVSAVRSAAFSVE